jgi:hypothetical protein
MAIPPLGRGRSPGLRLFLAAAKALVQFLIQEIATTRKTFYSHTRSKNLS